MFNSYSSIFIAKEAVSLKAKRVFYSIQRMYMNIIKWIKIIISVQTDIRSACSDSEYDWEKLFSERMFAAFHKNYGLKAMSEDINVYGLLVHWGGREIRSSLVA